MKEVTDAEQDFVKIIVDSDTGKLEDIKRENDIAIKL